MSKKPKLKVSSKNYIECSDWDDFVEQVYDKPYKFQQQDGCRDRGTYNLDVSDVSEDIDEEDITLKKWVNTPKDAFSNSFKYDWQEELYWEREFYPTVEHIAHDLFNKGLLAAGEYVIVIDW